MSTMRYSLILLLLSPLCIVNAQKMSNQEYIAQYKEIAMEEMRVHKIPASITLAQGILESGSGNSRLAMQGNNHFGIKCKKNWTGATIIEDDDEKNECFRAYNSPFESYKDHSLFLRENQRYAFLFELSILDYPGWAEGLRKAGYATNQRYPQLLIGLIERLNLAAYDTLVFYGEDKPWFTSQEGKPNIQIVDNGIPLTVARPGQDVRSIANENNMRDWQIYKYNDLPKGSKIEPGMVIYLKPKKNKAAVETHVVGEDESMWEISQKYGVKLKKLYKKNKMEEGTEVKPGETISMRRNARTMPDTGKVQLNQPKNNSPLSANPTPPGVFKGADPKYYTVQPGESFFAIAQKLNVPADSLGIWNRIDPLYANLKPQQQLVYFEIKNTKSKSHTVVQGETLYSIARAYGVSVEQIMQWNKMSSPTIYVGQNLLLLTQ